MASEVSICNLALSHLGDTATVASIRPPEASVQAQLCARFYPIARDSLLEMGSWGFATKRVALAAVVNPSTTWKYAYAQPAGMINALAVLSSDAIDDYEAQLPRVEDGYRQGYVPAPGALAYTPQPFVLETAADGSEIVLTNVCDAVFRFTTIVEDTTKFSPLFVTALSYLLGSMLAGPIIKGDAGRAESERLLGLFKVFEGEAESSDANQRRTHVEPAVSWIRGR